MKQAVHPNGLSVNVPETLFVEESPNGFIISPPGPKDFREPQHVLVALSPGAMVPSTMWADTCRVGGLPVYYRIEDSSETEAQQRYIFRAWVSHPAGCIRLVQVEQGFWPTVPEFDLAWTVIAGLTDRRTDE